MPATNWGMLEKSQADDETIEEAIDRLIAAHNDDVSSHLDTGQSLQSHKAQAIIDHAAASIVADKLSPANSFFEIPVNSVDSHNADNYSNLYPGFLAQLTQDDPLTDSATDYIYDFLLSEWGYVDGDIVLDIVLQTSFAAGTAQARWDTNFACIEMKAGFHRFGYYDGAWQYSDWIAASNATPYKFRIFFNSADSQIEFYRNGELVYSHAYTLSLIDGELIGEAILARGTSTYSSFYFGNIKVGFDSTT